ncbi:MAG: GNAT family N-acetyltransferase [Polyangiales bacterium]
MAPSNIRPAKPTDVREILALIRERADDERDPLAVVATEEALLRDGFGEQPRFRVFLAEVDGAVVGFAFYFFAYSTWRGAPLLYLEDLFVRPSHRGQKVGLALMRRLAVEANDQGCDRLVFQVLDWNTPAIAFYESLGAQVLRDWFSVRLDGHALKQLASGALR